MEQIPFSFTGGAFRTPTRRAIWHTTEGSTLAGAVATYKSRGICPHLTYEPATGRLAQHVPFDVAATTIKNAPGGVETNRWGAIQVEVVGFAAHPFTDGPLAGLSALLDLFYALGVPDGWPMGSPLPYPRSYGLNNGDRDASIWLATPGHYGHSQVPENDHGDPGAIDVVKLRRRTVSTVPAVSVWHDLKGSTMKTGLVTITTDDNGRGWKDVCSFDQFVAITAHGNSPADDGYRTTTPAFAVQDRGGKARVEVLGGPKNGSVRAHVTTTA